MVLLIVKQYTYSQSVHKTSEVVQLELYYNYSLMREIPTSRIKANKQDLILEITLFFTGRTSYLILEITKFVNENIIHLIWFYHCYQPETLMKLMQRFNLNKKHLRLLSFCPWYLSNQTLRKDFNIPYVGESISNKTIKHHIIPTKSLL